MKTPTSLKRLEELVARFDAAETSLWLDQPDETACDEVTQWLKYILDSLHSRKVYHKKRQILVREQVRLLKEHLSPDELAEVDKQAEREANEQLSEATKPASEHEEEMLKEE